MDPDFVSVPAEATVADSAGAAPRERARSAGSFGRVRVDDAGVLAGTVLLAELVRAEPQAVGLGR